MLADDIETLVQRLLVCIEALTTYSDRAIAFDTAQVWDDSPARGMNAGSAWWDPTVPLAEGARMIIEFPGRIHAQFDFKPHGDKIIFTWEWENNTFEILLGPNSFDAATTQLDYFRAVVASNISDITDVERFDGDDWKEAFVAIED
ncbi:MAG TPA: hypothetical protein EYP98_11645, partial [Planctomycetes bacterium]|nr:hypothetical protein [Planctomycetota bacterium]